MSQKSSSGRPLTDKVKVDFHLPELEIRIPLAIHFRIFSILFPLLRRPWFSVRMLKLFIVVSNVNYFIILASSNLILYLLCILYVYFSQVFISYIVRSLNPICQILLAKMKMMDIQLSLSAVLRCVHN